MRPAASIYETMNEEDDGNFGSIWMLRLAWQARPYLNFSLAGSFLTFHCPDFSRTDYVSFS